MNVNQMTKKLIISCLMDLFITDYRKKYPEKCEENNLPWACLEGSDQVRLKPAVQLQ